jgi:hypothetical protein
MPPEQPSAFRGWTLSPADRTRLLAQFPPTYPNVVADHVTFAGPQGAVLPAIDTVRVVGRADDGNGVQALVVEINGTTARPDGSTYHMTWSLAEGRKAQESNDVLRSRGWQQVEPTPISLVRAAS